MSLKHRACHTFTISKKQDNKTSVENTSKSSRDAGHLDGKSSKTVQILRKVFENHADPPQSDQQSSQPNEHLTKYLTTFQKCPQGSQKNPKRCRKAIKRHTERHPETRPKMNPQIETRI